ASATTRTAPPTAPSRATSSAPTCTGRCWPATPPWPIGCCRGWWARWRRWSCPRSSTCAANASPRRSRPPARRPPPPPRRRPPPRPLARPPPLSELLGHHDGFGLQRGVRERDVPRLHAPLRGQRRRRPRQVQRRRPARGLHDLDVVEPEGAEADTEGLH